MSRKYDSEYSGRALATGCFIELAFILLIAALCWLLAGCKSQQSVTDAREHYIHDTIYQTRIDHDSIYHRDSIYVTQWMMGDTVYRERYRDRYLYRDRWMHDTLRIVKSDTTTLTHTEVIEVRKPPSWFQRFRTTAGDIAMLGLLTFIVVYTIRRRYG